MAKLKQYTVSATHQDGRKLTIDVHAFSKQEAGQLAQRRYDYKLAGMRVVGPF